MERALQELINDAIGLGEQILGFATENEWEQVMLLETRYRDSLAQCFNGKPAGDDAEAFAAAIRQLLDLNDKTLAQIQRLRKVTSGDVEKIRVGRKARAAYSG